MQQDVFVVAYDGSDERVVDVAAERARKDGAALVVAHVLEWSPYSFLTPEELAERHKMRQQELSRAEATIMTPIVEKLRANGLAVDGELRYGNVVDLICAIAKEKNAALIFVRRSSSLSTRVFGSTASGVAQCATVPTVIVP